MSSSGSTVAAIILGTITLASVAGFIYYYLGRPKLLENGKKAGSDDDKKASKGDVNEVTVEDVGSSSSSKGEGSDDEVGEADEENNEEDDEEVKARAEEAAKQEEELKELKLRFDSATSQANKLLQGQHYARSAAKYSEALEIAKKLPGVNSSILSLYNNRSAVYEKMGEFELSLKDADIVLVMDRLHTKTRGRRHRIYEKLGKLEESLVEGIVVLHLEQRLGLPPSTVEKVDQITKLLSRQRAKTIVQSMMHANKPLPSKSYVRNFFVQIPSTHLWKEEFAASASDSDDAMVEQAVQAEAQGPLAKLEAQMRLVRFHISKSSFAQAFRALQECSVEGIEADSSGSSSDATKALLSLRAQLLGAESNLRCNLNQALAYYQEALSYQPDNIEAKLKLASLHIDLSDTDKAQEIYTQLLMQFAQPPSASEEGSQQGNAAVSISASAAATPSVPRSRKSGARTPDSDDDTDAGDLSPPPPATPASTSSAVATPTSSSSSSKEMRNDAAAAFAAETQSGAVSTVDLERLAASFADDADEARRIRFSWVLLHRAGCWTVKDASSAYRPQAVALAMQDLYAALALTKGVKASCKNVLGKAARLLALLKAVHIITHVKSQPGSGGTVASTESDHEKEVLDDREQCKRYIEEARQLQPQHENIKILSTDLLCYSGQFAEALEVCEELIRSAEPEDGLPLVLKANVLTQQALSSMDNGLLPEVAVMNLQNTIKDQVHPLFNKALEIDPRSIEALAQKAQLCNMMGDSSGAVECTRQALGLVRTKEEIVEMGVMLAMGEANVKAEKIISGDAV